MPANKRPRRGSIQFWHRKRAKRIYPSVNWDCLKEDKAKPLGFAGYKVGMTHIHYTKDNRAFIAPVTVIETPPLFICGIRFYDETKALGETWSTLLPKGIERKIGKGKPKKNYDYEKNSSGVKDIKLIVSMQPEKSGMHKLKPEVFEMGVGGSLNDKIEYAKSVVGKEVLAKDVLRSGDYCDSTAITKGHGFTGAVKRFGIRIQGRKDEQHHRHPGSVGSTTPRKIDWRVPMPGQHGLHQRIEYSKRIMLIESDSSKINPSCGWERYGLIKGGFMLIEGTVPGPRKRLVFFSIPRRTKKYAPVDIKNIILK